MPSLRTRWPVATHCTHSAPDWFPAQNGSRQQCAEPQTGSSSTPTRGAKNRETKSNSGRGSSEAPLSGIDRKGGMPVCTSRLHRHNAQSRFRLPAFPSRECVAKRCRPRAFLLRVVGERLGLQLSRRSSSRACALRRSSWSWASASGDNASTCCLTLGDNGPNFASI